MRQSLASLAPAQRVVSCRFTTLPAFAHLSYGGRSRLDFLCLLKSKNTIKLQQRRQMTS